MGRGTILFICDRQSQISAADAELKSEKVDRMISFDARKQGIVTSYEEKLDISDKLYDLENLIIPDIRLTNFEFDHKNGTTVIDGVTNDYKYLAQQIINLKKESVYENILVHKISNTKEGAIEFTLKAETLSQ
jgi:hypothetical protein